MTYTVEITDAASAAIHALAILPLTAKHHLMRVGGSSKFGM